MEGLRVLRGDRLPRAIALTSTLVNFLIAPLFAVIMPFYVRETFGSAGDLGVLLAGFGVGALAGSVLFGAVGHRLPRRATLIGGFVLLGLPMWVLAALPPLAVDAAALAATGLAAGALNPLAATIFQERMPAGMRGRVMGTTMATVLLAMPLGMLLAGSLIEVLGIRALLLAIAACLLATTVSLRFNGAPGELA